MTELPEIQSLSLMTHGGIELASAGFRGQSPLADRVHAQIRASLLSLGEVPEIHSDALEILVDEKRIVVLRGQTLVLAIGVAERPTRNLLVHVHDWLHAVETQFATELNDLRIPTMVAQGLRPLLLDLLPARLRGVSTAPPDPRDATTRPRMKVKTLLLGERGVRKTELIRRFVIENFDDRYIQTLGAKISKKEVWVREGSPSGEVRVDMMICDVFGSPGFLNLFRDAYFHGAKGLMAVCDIRDVSTLLALDHWINEVFSVGGEIPVVILVDRPSMVNLDGFGEREARRFAAQYNAPYFFTSSATGENMEQAFRTLAELVVERRQR